MKLACSMPYLLDAEGEPYPEPDLQKYFDGIEARERADRDWRKVARTEIGDVTVSTIFLAGDLRRDSKDPPELYQTVVFGGPDDGRCHRHGSRHEAQAFHNDYVSRLVDAALLDDGLLEETT